MVCPQTCLLLCLVHTHVLESCILSDCVIYKFEQSWMCFHTFMSHRTFLSFDIKTISKMRRKPQNVGNISSALHAEVFVSINLSLWNTTQKSLLWKVPKLPYHTLWLLRKKRRDTFGSMRVRKIIFLLNPTYVSGHCTWVTWLWHKLR